MNNCFPLRFNLNKSGYESAYSTAALAAMFNQSEEFIAETLGQYDGINSAAAEKIKEACHGLSLDFLKGERIMLCGDSNTSDRLSWGKIVQKVLPCTVIDAAVSGWRSVQLLSEIDRLLVTHKPGIVVVQIGNNDSFFTNKAFTEPCATPEEFRRNLQLIAKKVTAFGARLIINSLAPSWCEALNKNHGFWSATEENNSLYNGITGEVAAEYGCLHFDFRSIFEKERYGILFYPDGTHLNPQAHFEIAGRFVKFLGEAYGNN